MVFSSTFFLLVFLPLFLAIYYLTPFRGRSMVILLGSYAFYAWWRVDFLGLFIAATLWNYWVGIRLESALGTPQAKRWLALGIGVDLGVLAYFKYADFGIGSLNGLLTAVGGEPLPLLHLLLPIGISFYVFESISYLVDVYRKESPVQHRFVDLLLYISMFPQLIAGPIVRYGTVADEINDRHVSASDFAEGSYRFFIGLGKKVILANQLSEISDQFLVNGLGTLSTSGAWIGIIAFTLQIYFDFSGYSDMAIGMGRCLGFHFNENFRHPYCCDSITDFWRRWHISLGSFFRDYVYIPMGGNRRHQAVNIFVVWFLTGMWHGASWNFIIWGVYFGLIVMLEKYTILRIKDKIPSPVLHLYSLALVVIGWGIFYFDDFHSMQTFFNAFWGNAKVATDFVSESALLDNFWLWVAALLFCLPLRHVLSEFVERSCNERRMLKQSLFFVAHLSVSLVMLICSVALLVGATNNAFIYTRF